MGSAAVAGATLGLGGAALTAAGLSWLDGGIITGPIALFAAGKYLYNKYWGGAKTCPHCKSRQSCRFAVCRKCLRIIYPTTLPDCDKTPDLEWLDVASALQLRRLNYMEALELVKNHWRIEIHGDPKSHDSTVDCEDFLRWLRENKETIRKYRGTVEADERTDKTLDELGL